MPDVAPTTTEQVRAAAQALKDAVDRHLAAVERRTGEADPAVFAAFDELAAAADAYDELLYEVHDEVTPFEIPDRAATTDTDVIQNPGVISVLMRRDYLVTDAAAVVEAARAAEREAAEEEPDREPDVTDVGGAVAVLFDTFDADEIHERCEEVGLEPGDSTVWVLGSHGSEPGEWLEDPFSDASAERLLYRVDIVSDEEDEDDDGIELV